MWPILITVQSHQVSKASRACNGGTEQFTYRGWQGTHNPKVFLVLLV